ncbi:MAG: helix-turn-helix domain-containing protein [Verrucomicrobiota bacterium]
MNKNLGVNDLKSGDESPLLTKDELARMLKKSRRTIEVWVNAGYISSIRVGHSVFFEKDQVLSDLRRFQTGKARE